MWNRLTTVSQLSRSRVRHDIGRSLPVAYRSNSSNVATSQCPHQDTPGNDNIDGKKVTLFNVPKLPLVGSFIPQYSNTSKFDLTKIYDVWYVINSCIMYYSSFNDPYILQVLYQCVGMTTDKSLVTFTQLDCLDWAKVSRGLVGTFKSLSVTFLFAIYSFCLYIKQ